MMVSFVYIDLGVEPGLIRLLQAQLGRMFKSDTALGNQVQIESIALQGLS